MVKFKFSAHLPLDHLAHPVVSSLILLSANLLLSLIMWLTVSSLSPLLFTPWEFFISALADGFPLKSSQFSRTLLTILIDLNDADVWIVSTRLLISKSSSPFNNHLVPVPKISIPVGIIVIFMFHSFFNSLTRSRNLSFFSFSLNFTLWSIKVHSFAILFFSFFFLLRSVRLAEIRRSVLL